MLLHRYQRLLHSNTHCRKTFIRGLYLLSGWC
jgi:hypothetical protein